MVLRYWLPGHEPGRPRASTHGSGTSGPKAPRLPGGGPRGYDGIAGRPRSCWNPHPGLPMAHAQSPKIGALAFVACALVTGCAPQPTATDGRSWLAGDHHIHSRYSVGWDRSSEPPTPVVAGDGVYPIPTNALMAREFGLSWMVATDHGGPNHSKVNLELAYPELLLARDSVPQVIQFFGMEFDTPGADHSSLIVPHTHDEAERVHEIESTFSKNEPWPADPSWDTEPRMLDALRAMRDFPARPVVIANHPSRSAPDLGQYGFDHTAELRDWNDTAPEVAVGMAGAPGHQAVTLGRPQGARGGYGNFPTLGGFDQMTARLGGFWDSMLGEGRAWWITANSDSHVNWREGGADFWPGEYSKTYVWAERSHDDILAGIRSGRVFVTTGDLLSQLFVTASVDGTDAHIGGTLNVAAGADVSVTIRFLDPTGPNANGDDPTVARVDLIAGRVTGPVEDRSADMNPTTRVLMRWTDESWETDGPFRVMRFVLEDLQGDLYVRVRGTNGPELEPEPDPRGENPWTDLWFYSNPIFVNAR